MSVCEEIQYGLQLYAQVLIRSVIADYHRVGVGRPTLEGLLVPFPCPVEIAFLKDFIATAVDESERNVEDGASVSALRALKCVGMQIVRAD